MKTIAIGVFMFAVTTSTAFATAQYSDKVVYEGKTYSLHTNPMGTYFAQHPDKKPQGDVVSTALWRGYVATFEFKKNNLFLKAIEIQIWNVAEDGTSWRSAKDDVVPKGKKLRVDWFTGILLLPHGKLVKYVHGGYGSTYSDYILLEVKNGVLTDKRVFDHKGYEAFKERQFQAYRKTDAYKQQAAKLEKGGYSQERLDLILQHSIVNYTTAFLDAEESSDKPDAGEGK